MRSKKGDFSLGFVMGQTHAYLEQVVTGAKLAAQLGCSAVYVDDVTEEVGRQGCQSVVEYRSPDRVAVWMFKQDFVRCLIEEMHQNNTPPTAMGVWAMGKLFGYSDAEIGPYLHEHGLIKSASDGAPSQRHAAGSNDLRTEQGYSPC